MVWNLFRGVHNDLLILLSILYNWSMVLVNECRHDWSSDGCYVNTKLSNSTVVVCECSHLTHFAILLSPGLNVRSI